MIGKRRRASLSLSCSRGIVSSGQGDAGRTGARESIGRREAAPCRLFPYVYYAYLITFLLCPNPLPLSLSLPFDFLRFYLFYFCPWPGSLPSLRNLTQLESHTECIQESTRLFSLFLFDSFISFPALLCEERKKKKKKRIARRYICEAPGFIGSCCLSPCVSISQGSAISRLPYGRRGGGAARSISRWIMILFCVCSSSSPPSSLPPHQCYVYRVWPLFSFPFTQHTPRVF